MKRIICALLCAVMLVCSLTGCIATFDAKAYVQGNLDVVYLNKITDEYLKIVTNTKEELTAIYEEGLEVEAEYFASYFDFNMDLAPEGTKERIVEVYRQIYAYSKYEVGEPTKSGDDYLVSVTIYPIDIMNQINNEGWAAFEEAWLGMSETLATMTDEELEAAWTEMILDMVEGYISKIGYLEPETISVQIIKDESGAYVISDNDFGRIDTLIIAY